jgi:hypothetical protein
MNGSGKRFASEPHGGRVAATSWRGAGEMGAVRAATARCLRDGRGRASRVVWRGRSVQDEAESIIGDRAAHPGACNARVGRPVACRVVASRSRWRSARVHRGSASTPPGGYQACMTSASASRDQASVPIKVGVELEGKGREACRAAESNLVYMSRFRHRPACMGGRAVGGGGNDTWRKLGCCAARARRAD